ncbi:PPC domain-containing protein [Isosphaeraceae bacterium EP7]
MTRARAGRLTALSVLIGHVLFASNARAAAPTIAGITPAGVARGAAIEVTINGGALAGKPELVAPFKVTVEPAAPENKDAANWKFKATVDPATPTGVYAVRVKTEDGVSNPFLVAVGQVGQVAEVEENSTFETAQVITPPIVVEGQAAGNDVDYYKFAGKKGQKLVIDAQCNRLGSGVDPSIRLTTAGRAYVGSADDSAGLITDARLIIALPEDGDYVIELSDSRYQGGARPVYRLMVGEIPVAEEVYPLGGRQGETVGFEARGGTLEGTKIFAATIASLPGLFEASPRAAGTSIGLPMDLDSLSPVAVGETTEAREPVDPAAAPIRVASPSVINGRIDPAGDEDRFTLAVAPGQVLRVEVEAADLGSSLDAQLQILGKDGAVLTTADDAPTGRRNKVAVAANAINSLDPIQGFTVPAGLTEITLAITDIQKRGGIGYPYRIVVEPGGPGFSVTLNDGELSIPKGGTAALPVTVVRRDYAGPIQLEVQNLPAGLTARPGTIADGQLVGVLTLSAAADAAFGVTGLNVVGKATGPAGPIVARATKSVTFVSQGPVPTNTMTFHASTVAPALPAPASLDAPVGPIEVVHGYASPIPLKVTRAAGADAALAITAAPLPPGLTVPAVNVAEKLAEGVANVHATADVPLGAMTVALLAKGALPGGERTLAVPAVIVNVVRPAELQVAATAEVKAGETVEVKGKVVRKGAFKEPVTVKLDGLPAGLKADPVTVAPDASDFTIKVVAEPTAAAAMAAAKVLVAFQIEKKDYPTPPGALAIKVLPK